MLASSPEAALMPEIIADPLLPSCCHLFSGPGIQESQLLGPDPFLPRARDARGRFAKGSHLGNRDMAKSTSDKVMLAARADADSRFKKQSAGRARG